MFGLVLLVCSVGGLLFGCSVWLLCMFAIAVVGLGGYLLTALVCCLLHGVSVLFGVLFY